MRGPGEEVSLWGGFLEGGNGRLGFRIWEGG